MSCVLTATSSSEVLHLAGYHHFCHNTIFFSLSLKRQYVVPSVVMITIISWAYKSSSVIGGDTLVQRAAEPADRQAGWVDGRTDE